MKIRFRLALLAALLFAFTLPALAEGGYHLLHKFELGGEGGWDYLTFDESSNRLFISRATRVMVVDGATGKVITEIPDTPGVHGIAVAPKLNRAFISNGRENTVSIVDLKTFKLIEKVKVGTNPDAIIFDPHSSRAFAFNGRSSDVTAIDGASGKVAGTVALGGKPEFATSDEKGNIFVNIEDKNEIVKFDADKLAVKAHWPLAGCDEPSGMALDNKHHRIFSGCGNKVMTIVDAESGKLKTTVPIGSGVDANGFDPGTGLVFASNGDGTLTVVHEDSPDKFTVVGNVATKNRARTMALDPKTHNVYLVTADFGTAPAATTEQPHPRPPMVPNTFVVLVYGK